MNIEEMNKAILFIRPDAKFAINGETLIWLDDNQTEPSKSEIQAGWIAYQAKLEADKAEASAKREALLERLGITEEEAKLLLS